MEDHSNDRMFMLSIALLKKIKVHCHGKLVFLAFLSQNAVCTLILLSTDWTGNLLVLAHVFIINGISYFIYSVGLSFGNIAARNG